MPSSLTDKPSEDVDQAIERHVMLDLDPPPSTVHAKVGLASALGGVLSLATCGQFGTGLTPFAVAFSEAIHAEMGAVPCALICGAFYALFPVAILKLGLCSPMQFRTIVHRRRLVVAFWFGGFGGLFAAFGHHGSNLGQLSAWMASALMAAYLVARAAQSFDIGALFAGATSRGK